MKMIMVIVRTTVWARVIRTTGSVRSVAMKIGTVWVFGLFESLLSPCPKGGVRQENQRRGWPNDLTGTKELSYLLSRASFHLFRPSLSAVNIRSLLEWRYFLNSQAMFTSSGSLLSRKG